MKTKRVSRRHGRPLSYTPLVGANEVRSESQAQSQYTRTHARNAHARTCICKHHLLYITCCSSSSRECWNVEYYESLSLERYFMDYFDVNTFVDNLLNCWKCSNMHKTICATFCGKPVELLKVLKTVVKGSPESETRKSRHALRTAHRA